MEDLKSAVTTTESSRRQFLIRGTGILSIVCGVIVGIPLVGSFIGPKKSSADHWIKVADLRDLPAGQPIGLKAADVERDAYLQDSVVRRIWVVKHNDDTVTAFSPTCPHLGCQVDWNAASGRFECPCHGSVYAPDGKVLGGPAPRPLDTLATRIRQGGLSVNWQRFRSGIARKIPV
ncbi:MAG: ubiquinol-cytochrome c reductase iron-sulfur subunit [Deltaproteobacteria bacterium]|nr:ubiquinol-cytochrome c reductase iron-sulfur subunit [Deltaproteobacteria bacterium]